MPVISLMSFLNLLGKAPPQKIREYNKYRKPGGYDYYWQLKDAAFNLTVGGLSFERCLIPLQKIKRQSERTHNIARLQSLSAWISRPDYAFFAPPRCTFSSPKGHLRIRLEPEFGIIADGKRKLIHLWSNQGQLLKPTIAGAGIYLMNEHLAKDQCIDCTCEIRDLTRGLTFTSDRIPSYVATMVNSELAWVDSFFEEVEKAA